MLPPTIRDREEFWKAIVLNKTHENEVIEFKQELNLRDPNLAQELARDIVAMANTWGGVILVGVEETTCDGEYRVATAVLGISEAERKQQFVETSVQNYVVPSTLPYSVYPLHPTDDLTVLIINVRALESGVAAIWREPKKPDRYVQYPYRTFRGKNYMTPPEVEERLMNGSRAVELRLRRLAEGTKEAIVRSPIRVLIMGTLRLDQHMNSQLKGFRILNTSDGVNGYEQYSTAALVQSLSNSEVQVEFGVEFGVARATLSIPYGMIQEVWSTHTGAIGLMLSVRVVVPWGGTAYLQPL